MSPVLSTTCLFSVCQGGFLFQWFFENNASDHFRKIYKKELATDPVGCLNPGATSAMVEQLGNKFLGFVCTILNVHGSGAREQLFFATYAARYHGLSRLGVSMFAAIGQLMPLSSVDRIAKEYHGLNRSLTRCNVMSFIS